MAAKELTTEPQPPRNPRLNPQPRRNPRPPRGTHDGARGRQGTRSCCATARMLRALRADGSMAMRLALWVGAVATHAGTTPDAGRAERSPPDGAAAPGRPSGVVAGGVAAAARSPSKSVWSFGVGVGFGCGPALTSSRVRCVNSWSLLLFMFVLISIWLLCIILHG